MYPTSRRNSSRNSIGHKHLQLLQINNPLATNVGLELTTTTTTTTTLSTTAFTRETSPKVSLFRCSPAIQWLPAHHEHRAEPAPTIIATRGPAYRPTSRASAPILARVLLRRPSPLSQMFINDLLQGTRGRRVAMRRSAALRRGG